MKTLTVKKLRQLLFEVKDQEANVVMFTEGDRECIPLVSIQDDSNDLGIVSLGFLDVKGKDKLHICNHNYECGQTKCLHSEPHSVDSEHPGSCHDYCNHIGMFMECVEVLDEDEEESYEAMVNRGQRGSDL